MEAAEVTSRQPDDGEVATPIPRFVVIVGDSADDGAALRVENPARLLRVWSLLRATRELLDSAALPPGGMPRLQRQLQSIRHELEVAVSPPLVAELRRILPSHDATPSAGALRIESAVLESWADSLVVQMLSVYVAATDHSQQGHGDRTAA
jgi:proteasome activator-like protein